ncbi:MAG: ABC transporter ATP-binding protein [Candidatus Puniceispirillaceae bacterium]
MTDKAHHENGGHPPFSIMLNNIVKRFGPVLANDHVDLKVKSGHIHGIIGENGAGKSTLVSILYGFYQADSGDMLLHGKPVSITSSSDAIAAGIGMVHQHFMLVPNFTALENVILGYEVDQKLAPSLAAGRARLDELASRYGLEVPLDVPVGDLPVGLQQRVEILKTLYRGAEILILDEPTGVLTPQETKQLFEILKTLREQGVTILLITHKLKEIMAITDEVSVMRQGQMVAHKATSATTPTELANLMVGRSVLLELDKQQAKAGKTVLEVKNLSHQDGQGAPRLRDVSFSVRAGEILGVAGVSGNGQSELLEILSGITPPQSGQVIIKDQLVDQDHPCDPAKMRQMGVAHVPEDRHAMGMVLPFTAAESAILGYEDEPHLGRGFWLSPKKITQHCQNLMARFDVRPLAPLLKSNLFSGGNQQKIVLAREISKNPDILLVGQPTRGVDIGAIEFIHNQLLALRDKGCAVVVVSVELDEILSLSDRIMVMNNGEVVGTVESAEADETKLGLMMAGIDERQVS